MTHRVLSVLVSKLHWFIDHVGRKTKFLYVFQSNLCFSRIAYLYRCQKDNPRHKLLWKYNFYEQFIPSLCKNTCRNWYLFVNLCISLMLQTATFWQISGLESDTQGQLGVKLNWVCLVRRLKGRGWQNTGNQRKQTHPKGERVRREKVQGKKRDKQELVKLLDYKRKINDLAGGYKKEDSKTALRG